jgi:hypothetical protein
MPVKMKIKLTKQNKLTNPTQCNKQVVSRCVVCGPETSCQDSPPRRLRLNSTRRTVEATQETQWTNVIFLNVFFSELSCILTTNMRTAKEYTQEDFFNSSEMMTHQMPMISSLFDGLLDLIYLHRTEK